MTSYSNDDVFTEPSKTYLKLQAFEEKNKNRIVDISWSKIPFYRKKWFLKIIGWLGFMIPLITLVYVPIILICIWATGPTFSQRNFGGDAIIYKHKRYTLLIIAVLMLTLHVAAIIVGVIQGIF